MTDPLLEIPGLIIHESSTDRLRFSADCDPAAIQSHRVMVALFLGLATVFLVGSGILTAAVVGPGSLVIFVVLWLLTVGIVGGGALLYERKGGPKVIDLTSEAVTVQHQHWWGERTATYPSEHDQVVEWLVESGSEDSEPTWHIELLGSSWRVPLGYSWPKDVQARFVEALRVHVGQTLRAVCPGCKTPLSVRDVDRATGRQHCSQCDWRGRGRQPPSLSTAEGNLLLPPLPSGPIRIELATPELLILHIGTRLSSWLVLVVMLLVVGMLQICCCGGLLTPLKVDPQQAAKVADTVGVFWVGAIAIGLVVCVVLYWHRHYRQTITLTANRTRQDVEIVRSVSWLPVRTWVTFDGGGHVCGEPTPWPLAGIVGKLVRAGVDAPPDVQLVDAQTHRAHSVGQRLRPQERRWLIVVLNRFLGTPQFCTPDGRPYPETCPMCGQTLSPDHIDTESGVLRCTGFPTCFWSTALGERDWQVAENFAQAQAAINNARRRWDDGLTAWNERIEPLAANVPLEDVIPASVDWHGSMPQRMSGCYSEMAAHGVPRVWRHGRVGNASFSRRGSGHHASMPDSSRTSAAVSREKDFAELILGFNNTHDR